MAIIARVFLLLTCTACLSLAAAAQIAHDTDENEIIRVDTQLIDVPVQVIDKSGRPQLGLKQSNFVIYEDGRKQLLADFSTTSAPFELSLVLDTSGSTRSDLQLIQRAAESFIGSLRPGDRVSLISYKADRSTGKELSVSEVLRGLTDDREALKTALSEVKTGNGTPYYDSLMQVVAQVFDKKPAEQFRGRRALIALTDGVDSNSAADFAAVKKALEKAGIICYFIQVDTSEYFESNVLGDCKNSLWFSQSQIRRYYTRFYPQSNFEKVYDFCKIGEFERLDISHKLYGLAGAEMNDLAKMSGGRVFPIADLNSAKAAFEKVAQEIGTQYRIGYYPDNEKNDGAFRSIRVEIKGLPAGATVRAREGYTAPKK